MSDAGPAVALAEFAARRARLLESQGGAVGLVFAGPAGGHAVDTYAPHPHFEYLTGLTDEPGAVLLLDPGHPTAKRRVQLFLKPVDPEINRWDGERPEISGALRETLGIETILRTSRLPGALGAAARRSRELACLHPLALHTQAVSPDLAVFRKVAERIPGARITDASELLPRMRARKSAAEIEIIRHAIDITADGFAAAVATLKGGVAEFAVQTAVEHAFRQRMSRRLAFTTIAGTGFNATILHYRANSGTLADGQLICIDAGAKWGGYSADITRTFPVSGTYDGRQRELYEIVLEAQAAAIAASVPGATMTDIDDAARAVIDGAGLGDHFIHGIGHHLGLETHDVTPDEPLDAGAVITIEPGVYLREEAIGIRIEDDVLLTADGPVVLSPQIPKTVAEVEAAFAAR